MGFSSNNICKIPDIKALFSMLLLNSVILFVKFLKKNNKWFKFFNLLGGLLIKILFSKLFLKLK